MAKCLWDAKENEAVDFHPGEFLREKVLKQITSIQMLIYGNVDDEEARNFSQTQVVDRFQIVDEHPNAKGSPLYISNTDPQPFQNPEDTKDVGRKLMPYKREPK